MADKLDALKTEAMNAAIDGRTLQSEGLEDMAKHSLGSIVLLFFSEALYLKILWGVLFAGALLVF